MPISAGTRLGLNDVVSPLVFLKPVRAKRGSSSSIHVVLNWPALLKKDEPQ
jgi:hypothetical protein